ncbi:hypothetical protein HYU93_01050 [Candidatus Daviesbacteria bacterium]|nr:hypothetical protein [Candidatus Daviesbacteria bacterium]
MERRTEHPTSERLPIQPPTFREWLVAVVYLPVTLQRLAEGLHRLSTEMRLMREAGYVADIIEVWDFNRGFYPVFGGRVGYRGKPKNESSELKTDEKG